jgi:hypothetical protein
VTILGGMELTVLKCPSCGATIEAGDIDFARSLATCHHCKSLISLWRPGGSAENRPPQPRSPVPLPKKFKVSSGDSRVKIEWRWWTPAYLVLFAFCLFWNLFLGLLFYSITFSGHASVFAYLCPILHVAVGVGLAWVSLAVFFNRTEVTVDNGVLRVWIGPIPWPGKLTCPVKDLRQLYVRREIHHGKNGSRETFDVMAVSATGSRRVLLRALRQQDQALFVEQELERFLRIYDEPVIGEVDRP